MLVQGYPGGRASLMAQWVKNLPAMEETQVMQLQSLGQGDTLEEEMGIHSTILAWETPCTEESDRKQPVGLQ